MGTQAQQEPDAMIFWNEHGLNATQDAFRVSRTTLYRRCKAYREADLSALHNRSTASRTCRRRHWPPKLCAEVRRLRQVFPNLGREKLHVLLQPWCERHGLTCLGRRTIGRLIALIVNTPDKMRCVAVQITPKGKLRPVRRQFKQRLGKGFRADYPELSGALRRTR